MIDFKSVLGSVLESGLLPPSASQRIGSALDSARQAASDTKREAQAGNPMAVGGLGALAGAVLGGVRGSPAKGALGGAALALLGQIAVSALQKGLGGAVPTGATGVGETSAGDAAERSAAAGLDENARAELLLRAMINAAKADGQIDGSEMSKILDKLDEAGAGPEARDFVLAEMRRPLDLEGLAAAATSPDLAASVYAASVMAIRVDTPAEKSYLDRLADRLGLAPAIRASLDASMGVGRSTA